MSDETTERRLELVVSNAAEDAHPDAPTPIRGAEVVRLLEQILADAREGRFVAVGVYAVTPSGSVTCWERGDAMANVQCVAGAALLQRSVTDRVLGR